MIAARQEPQALRRLVEQFRLGQDAAADRHHGIGGDDEGAAQLVGAAHASSAASRLGAREPRRVGARQLPLGRDLVDVGRQQLVGLDARLVEQPEPARRAGGEDELGPADHGVQVHQERVANSE